MRAHPREQLEPEVAQLGQYGALVRHGLVEDDVERADAIARDHQQGRGVDLVHLTHLAPAQQRQRQPAGDERRAHTFTSAGAAAGATASISRIMSGITWLRNSSTCSGARPTYADGSSSSAVTLRRS